MPETQSQAMVENMASVPGQKPHEQGFRPPSGPSNNLQYDGDLNSHNTNSQISPGMNSMPPNGPGIPQSENFLPPNQYRPQRSRDFPVIPGNNQISTEMKFKAPGMPQIVSGSPQGNNPSSLDKVMSEGGLGNNHLSAPMNGNIPGNGFMYPSGSGNLQRSNSVPPNDFGSQGSKLLPSSNKRFPQTNFKKPAIQSMSINGFGSPENNKFSPKIEDMNILQDHSQSPFGQKPNSMAPGGPISPMRSNQLALPQGNSFPPAMPQGNNIPQNNNQMPQQNKILNSESLPTPGRTLHNVLDGLSYEEVMELLGSSLDDPEFGE